MCPRNRLEKFSQTRFAITVALPLLYAIAPRVLLLSAGKVWRSPRATLKSLPRLRDKQVFGGQCSFRLEAIATRFGQKALLWFIESSVCLRCVQLCMPADMLHTGPMLGFPQVFGVFSKLILLTSLSFAGKLPPRRL